MDLDSGGWLDFATLREWVPDRAAAEQGCTHEDPLIRLQSLRLLGRLPEAKTLISLLIEQAKIEAAEPPMPGHLDNWRLMVTAADVYADSADGADSVAGANGVAGGDSEAGAERVAGADDVAGVAGAERVAGANGAAGGDGVVGADADRAAALQALGWRLAVSRERQADTLAAFAIRDLHHGAPDAAAAKLELVLALRRGFAAAEVLEADGALMARIRQRLAFDAIVLAGGRGERMGGHDKPRQKLAGWPLLDHVLLACSAASRRIVVGPPQRVLADPSFCREEPVGAGPLAAIAAALPLVRAPMVAVLAADLPFIAPMLPALRKALLAGQADVAVVVDPTGTRNYLAAMWNQTSLRAALERLDVVADRPVRALFEGVDIAHVDDLGGYGTDCDTWPDLELAAVRIMHRNRERLGATPLAWPGLELYSPS